MSIAMVSWLIVRMAHILVEAHFAVTLNAGNITNVHILTVFLPERCVMALLIVHSVMMK